LSPIQQRSSKGLCKTLLFCSSSLLWDSINGKILL
jgi:hypothetical protein